MNIEKLKNAFKAIQENRPVLEPASITFDIAGDPPSAESVHSAMEDAKNWIEKSQPSYVNLILSMMIFLFASMTLFLLVSTWKYETFVLLFSFSLFSIMCLGLCFVLLFCCSVFSIMVLDSWPEKKIIVILFSLFRLALLACAVFPRLITAGDVMPSYAISFTCLFMFAVMPFFCKAIIQAKGINCCLPEAENIVDGLTEISPETHQDSCLSLDLVRDLPGVSAYLSKVVADGRLPTVAVVAAILDYAKEEKAKAVCEQFTRHLEGKNLNESFA